jgi:hypothetical protein
MTALAAVLVLAAVFLGPPAGYAFACWQAPFGRCRRCRGVGRRTARWWQRLEGRCRFCDGTGRRVRLGRRLYTYLRSVYDDAH